MYKQEVPYFVQLYEKIIVLYALIKYLNIILHNYNNLSPIKVEYLKRKKACLSSITNSAPSNILY